MVGNLRKITEDWRYDVCVSNNHSFQTSLHVLIMRGKLGFPQEDTNPLLKLALVLTTFVCVNLCEFSSATRRACLALSSGRAVIKEELHWAVSQRAVSAQTSNSSLKNPLTSTQRPYSPLTQTPNLHPLPSLCSWLGSKLGLGIFHCILLSHHSQYCLCPVWGKEIHPYFVIYHLPVMFNAL